MKNKSTIIYLIEQFHSKSTKIILIRLAEPRNDGFRYKIRLKRQNGREEEIEEDVRKRGISLRNAT